MAKLKKVELTKAKSLTTPFGKKIKKGRPVFCEAGSDEHAYYEGNQAFHVSDPVERKAPERNSRKRLTRAQKREADKRRQLKAAKAKAKAQKEAESEELESESEELEGESEELEEESEELEEELEEESEELEETDGLDIELMTVKELKRTRKPKVIEYAEELGVETTDEDGKTLTKNKLIAELVKQDWIADEEE